MIAHLIGRNPCPHASEAARELAHTLKGLKKGGESGSTSTSSNKRKGASVITNVAKKMRQTELKVFRGVDIPFSEEEATAVERQVLKATVSANLPFRWIENPEIIKLFHMLRTQAYKVLPSRRVIATRLLREEGERVDADLKILFKEKYVTLSYVEFSL